MSTKDDHDEMSAAARKSLEAVREAIKGYIGGMPDEERKAVAAELKRQLVAGEFNTYTGEQCIEWIVPVIAVTALVVPRGCKPDLNAECAACLMNDVCGQVESGPCDMFIRDRTPYDDPGADECDCGRCSDCQGCPEGEADVLTDAKKV